MSGALPATWGSALLLPPPFSPSTAIPLSPAPHSLAAQSRQRVRSPLPAPPLSPVSSTPSVVAIFPSTVQPPRHSRFLPLPPSGEYSTSVVSSTAISLQSLRQPPSPVTHSSRMRRQRISLQPSHQRRISSQPVATSARLPQVR